MGECGSGGPLADGGSNAGVEIGRETRADGTGSVPVTPNEKRRGWDSVVVEESDVLACGGYLPERYVGGSGDGDGEAERAAAMEMGVPNPGAGSSESEGAGTCGAELTAGGLGEVRLEELAGGADPGCDEGVGGSGDEVQIAEKAPNEANLCDDVCTAQREGAIEVPANSGGVSGLDGCQANPIFLETKPIPAGGVEGGRVGGSATQPAARALTEYERRNGWKEIRRQQWIRERSEKEAREREAQRGSGWRG